MSSLKVPIRLAWTKRRASSKILRAREASTGSVVYCMSLLISSGFVSCRTDKKALGKNKYSEWKQVACYLKVLSSFVMNRLYSPDLTRM